MITTSGEESQSCQESRLRGDEPALHGGALIPRNSCSATTSIALWRLRGKREERSSPIKKRKQGCGLRWTWWRSFSFLSPSAVGSIREVHGVIDPPRENWSLGSSFIDRRDDLAPLSPSDPTAPSSFWGGSDPIGGRVVRLRHVEVDRPGERELTRTLGTGAAREAAIGSRAHADRVGSKRSSSHPPEGGLDRSFTDPHRERMHLFTEIRRIFPRSVNPPIIGWPPAPVSPHRGLGRPAQRREGAPGRSFAIEAPHELGGRAVLHRPEADQDLAGAGREEAAGEADQPFAADLAAQRRPAGREHHQIRGRRKR